MQWVAITAVGRDRPGIVAEFTEALYRFGCNLEDTTMTRLRGEFAMILLARLPDGGNFEALRRTLETTAEKMGLSVVIRRADPEEAALSRAEPAQGYLLSVYGADKPGIVHAATSLLAERRLNITDLNTRVIPGGSGPVYVMLLEVDIPSEREAEALRPALERLSRELQVDIAFRPLEQESL